MSTLNTYKMGCEKTQKILLKNIEKRNKIIDLQRMGKTFFIALFLFTIQSGTSITTARRKLLTEYFSPLTISWFLGCRASLPPRLLEQLKRRFLEYRHPDILDDI